LHLVSAASSEPLLSDFPNDVLFDEKRGNLAFLKAVAVDRDKLHGLLMPKGRRISGKGALPAKNTPASVTSRPFIEVKEEPVEGKPSSPKNETGMVTRGQERDRKAADMEKREAEELSLAHDAMQKLAALRLVPRPPWPLDNLYRDLQRCEQSPERSRQGEALELLLYATKDIAICPSRIESWTCAATAFRDLYFHADDAQCINKAWLGKEAKSRELWWREVEGSGSHASHVWEQPQRWTYCQARVFNLMILSHLEADLGKELEELAALSNRASSETEDAGLSCKSLAKQWFERQLDTLQLLRCKKTCLSSASGESSSVLAALRQCDSIARKLLWVLVNCSDYSQFSLKQHIIERLKDWPRPCFADSWLRLAASNTGFRLMDFCGMKALPAYLSYVPYMVGRVNWKISRMCPGDKQVLSESDILYFLQDATNVQAAAREHNMASMTDARYLCQEPLWRLHITKLAMASTKSGMHSLEDTQNNYETNLQRCYDALQKPGLVERRQERVALLLGKRALGEGNLEEASNKALEIIKEVVKSFQQLPSSSSASFTPDGSLDPYDTHTKWHRKKVDTWKKCLHFCLRVYKEALQAVLKCKVKIAGAVVDASEPDEPFLQTANNIVKNCPGAVVHEKGFESFINGINTLSEAVPEGHQALVKASEALVFVVKKTSRLNGSAGFNDAVFATCLKALRSGFGALTRASLRPDSEQCYMNWALLSQLRSLCRFVEHSCRGYKPLIDLRKQLYISFLQSASQLKHTALTLCDIRPSFKPSKMPSLESQWYEPAEAFFVSVKDQVTLATGLWGSSQDRWAEEHDSDGHTTIRVATDENVHDEALDVMAVDSD